MVATKIQPNQFIYKCNFSGYTIKFGNELPEYFKVKGIDYNHYRLPVVIGCAPNFQ